jgi:hypothetical protein
MQKAETGSIGRALATLGFGTMAALEEGHDNVFDAPVERPRQDEQPMGYPCAECNREVDYQTAGASRRHFNGRVFCGPCGRRMKEGMKAQGALACDCGQIVTEKVANASIQGLGKIVCVDCQQAMPVNLGEERKKPSVLNPKRGSW